MCVTRFRRAYVLRGHVLTTFYFQLIPICSDPSPTQLMRCHLRLTGLREDALVVHGVHTVHCRTCLEVGEVPYHHAGDVVLGVGQIEIVCNELALELLAEHIMIK